ncbi:MAG: glutamate 5-kinase [Geminicoccaceae bacterium]|nr:glutamate 5-kinase [Geminicoccaceae bacterium]
MAGVADLLAARRIVVKVGSALLVDERGHVRRPWLERLALDLAGLQARGQRVIVVTSGAVALGRRALDLRRRTLPLEEKQAAAAAGQIVLARAWQESLADRGQKAAQILITPDDTEDRRRYLNARATVETLLRLGVVPVVNENDTVATAELRFGDNDRLAARVAVMMLAETLVLLSDVDGLYTADPATRPDARHVPRVERLTPEIEAMAGASRTGVGTGGMVSKLAAVAIATRAGTSVVLTAGSIDRPLRALADGARATCFPAPVTPRRARKDWIGASLASSGRLHIDEGAVGALRRGSSLLPAGVTRVEGTFERGDAVLVLTPEGVAIGKGLCAYDADDARAIAGRRTGEIGAILGWRGRDEMIHRDDLALS